MPNRLQKQSAIIGWTLVGIAVATLLISCALYFFRFGPGLSYQSSEWGEFGDFVGGFVGTILTALTLIALAWNVILQARTLRETREIFLSSQRPWITINLSIAGPMEFHVDGMRMSVLVRLKNVGHSPALNVAFLPELRAPARGNVEDFSSQKIQQQRITENKTAPMNQFGYTMFPEAEHVTKCILNMDAAELARIMHGGPILPDSTEFICPMILGFVHYNFALGGGQHHQTACIYDVSRSNHPRPEATADNRAPEAICPKDGNIPMEELRLRHQFGGDYAD